MRRPTVKRDDEWPYRPLPLWWSPGCSLISNQSLKFAFTGSLIFLMITNPLKTI